MKQYVLDVAGLSDRGKKRDHNEDAWSAPRSGLSPQQLATKGRLYVVADGVGGHLAGDVASKMAVEIIQQRYYADPSPDVAANLSAAIQAASDQIDQEAAARPERRGMSTTVTAAVLLSDELTVANVGDSRTYLVREGHARQMTADHSWVEEQVRGGIITREEAARHPQRNIITRSLGTNRELEIDVFEERLEPGDGVLLCSDGLSNMVTDHEIGTVISKGWRAEAVVKELVGLANQRGAPDNVTAVLINVVRPARGGCGRIMLVAGVFAALAVLAAGLALGRWLRGDESSEPISISPVSEPDTSLARPTVVTPLAPVSTPLELVWPAENTDIVAGDSITFVWEWTGTARKDDERFIFVLRAGRDSQTLVREELPLSQRQFVVSRPLDPGGYLWTMAVSGAEVQGASVGRLFRVVEPTRVPDASTTPEGSSPD